VWWERGKDGGESVQGVAPERRRVEGRWLSEPQAEADGSRRVSGSREKGAACGFWRADPRERVGCKVKARELRSAKQVREGRELRTVASGGQGRRRVPEKFEMGWGGADAARRGAEGRGGGRAPLEVVQKKSALKERRGGEWVCCVGRWCVKEWVGGGCVVSSAIGGACPGEVFRGVGVCGVKGVAG